MRVRTGALLSHRPKLLPASTLTAPPIFTQVSVPSIRLKFGPKDAHGFAGPVPTRDEDFAGGSGLDSTEKSPDDPAPAVDTAHSQMAMLGTVSLHIPASYRAGRGTATVLNR